MNEQRAHGRARRAGELPETVQDDHDDAPVRSRSAAERVRAARRAAPEDAPSPAASGNGSEPSDAAAESAERTARDEGLELVARLAEGGGTRTWLARERTSREEFTVTFALHPDPSSRAALEAHFAETARVWAERSSPALVGVRATLGEGEQACALVADHVTGRALSEIVRSRGRMDPETLLPVLADGARGLAALHDGGWAHGALAAHHVIVTRDGRALLDGYGMPCGSSRPPVAWGQAERSSVGGADPGTGPEVPASSSGRATAAQDVHDLAVMGWLALTGRHPGPTSHRVPLTLMCPSAPRYLVLMLEAALSEDAADRPSAHELAAAFDAPVRKTPTARRPHERMTPEVIRADGTVLRGPRRLPLLREKTPGGGSSRAQPPAGRRGRSRLRERTARDGASSSARVVTGSPGEPGDGATAVLRSGPSGRGRALVVAAAAVAVAGVVALGYGVWSDDGGWGSRAGAASSFDARPNAEGEGKAGAAGEDASGTGGQATSQGDSSAQPGETAGDAATGTPDASATGSTAPTTVATAPGESMQDKDRAAREAVGELVSRRASALAAGDEAAAEAVYVPQSGLATRDRDMIRRAAAQASSGTGATQFAGLSMEVVSLVEQEPETGTHLTPAEAARSRTYDAEVLTRGWTGELPSSTSVTAAEDGARQHLRLTVLQTSQGWRLADVTPVAGD